MSKNSWLGEYIGIDILSLFKVNYNSYIFEDKQETERIKGDIKRGYRELSQQLHPDRQRQFPSSIQRIAEDLFKEISDLYTILTSEEKYTNPRPQDGEKAGYVSVTLSTFPLTAYIINLKNNTPEKLPLTQIVNDFLETRREIEQMIAKHQNETTTLNEQLTTTRNLLKLAVQERNGIQDYLDSLK